MATLAMVDGRLNVLHRGGNITASPTKNGTFKVELYGLDLRTGQFVQFEASADSPIAVAREQVKRWRELGVA